MKKLRQGGEVPYSPSLSWCEAEPGGNPGLSKAPQHTLLCRLLSEAVLSAGGRGWAGDGLISYKHLPALLEIPAPLWPNPCEGQIQN